jgi:hypothetical protein
VISFAFPIEKRLKEALSNKARIALRRVRLKEGDRAKAVEVLRKFLEEHEGKGYEGFVTLVKSRFRANNHDDLNEMFCSELVARALMDLGLITDGGRLASNYLPSDFACDEVPGAAGAFEALKRHANTSHHKPRSRRASEDIDATGITSPREARMPLHSALSPMALRKHRRGKSDATKSNADRLE